MKEEYGNSLSILEKGHLFAEDMNELFRSGCVGMSRLVGAHRKQTTF